MRRRLLETLHAVRWAAIVAAMISLAGWSIAELSRQHVLNWPLVSGDATDHLGAEYDNIGRAIYEGRGFSDPFDRGTGPTAWMPPMLPSIIATAYWAAGGNRDTLVMEARVLQVLSVWLVLTLVLQPFQASRFRWLVAGITLLAVVTHLFYLFQFTHDHTVLMMLVTVLWAAMAFWWKKPVSWFSTSAAGLGGGLLALFNPAIGAVWAILTLARLRFEPRHLLAAAVISLAVVAPWILRCHATMGRWIPIKSNSAYELWQAHVLDSDGVVDVALFQTHPYNGSSDDGKVYEANGEIALLDEKREQWRQWVSEHPSEYGSRVFNRMSAAFIQPVLFDPSHYQRALSVAASDVWVILCSISLVVALWRNPANAVQLRLAIAIWLLTLLPYLLVSYYLRYDILVFPMRLFVVLSALFGQPSTKSIVVNSSNSELSS